MTPRRTHELAAVLPPEVVASHPMRIQALLGWQASKETRMGWFEISRRMSEPIELLGRWN